MEPLRTVVLERVLVIDDDVELCQLVTRFMAAEGFAIDCATNGRHGVERALSGDFALVVLDVMMPDVSGFDVLRRIRAKSRTPVLMLTARGDTLDRVLGLEMGPTTTCRNRSIRRSSPPASAPFCGDHHPSLRVRSCPLPRPSWWPMWNWIPVPGSHGRMAGRWNSRRSSSICSRR